MQPAGRIAMAPLGCLAARSPWVPLLAEDGSPEAALDSGPWAPGQPEQGIWLPGCWARSDDFATLPPVGRGPSVQPVSRSLAPRATTGTVVGSGPVRRRLRVRRRPQICVGVQRAVQQNVRRLAWTSPSRALGASAICCVRCELASRWAPGERWPAGLLDRSRKAPIAPRVFKAAAFSRGCGKRFAGMYVVLPAALEVELEPMYVAARQAASLACERRAQIGEIRPHPKEFHRF